MKGNKKLHKDSLKERKARHSQRNSISKVERHSADFPGNDREKEDLCPASLIPESESS